MEIISNFELGGHNTFGVDAKATLCSIISSEQDLLDSIDENKTRGKILYPLGGGSNILLTGDQDKWILINQLKGIHVFYEDDKEVILDVKSGENWHEFVLFCLENKWYGLENLSLIPGSVGAAPIQNIGAYGVEVKDFILSVRFIDLESKAKLILENEAIQFAYRNSIFKEDLKGKVFIESVRFKLKKDARVNVKYQALIDELTRRAITDPTPKDISDAVIAVRKSKLPDPAKIGNSGSFFKNPVVDAGVLHEIQKQFDEVPNYPAEAGKVKLAAGWLIEKAGWKGYRKGDIGVHEKQALVLVNYANGKGKDIQKLSETIIQDIYEKFGVRLECEVNIL